MKQGKIAEPVCKRSVLKYVKKNQEEMLRGAALQDDCALFSCQTVTFPVSGILLIRRAIYAAVNDLAAKGCRADTITLAITVPERIRESKLAQMMEEAQMVCDKLRITIIGGHTLVSDSVNDPVISVTAQGRKNTLVKCSTQKKEDCPKKDGYKGYDILVTGFIGMDAVSLIAHAREKQLFDRFPKTFVMQAKEFEQTLSAVDTAKRILTMEDTILLPIREGGIFATLWTLAGKTGAGLTVDLKKIPMKQTVVEISNYYDLNPYEMLSTGCLLLVSKDGEALSDALLANHIQSQIIGRVTDSNDKVIENADETRYLDLPKPDQIRKILSHEAQFDWLRSVQADGTDEA